MICFGAAVSSTPQSSSVRKVRLSVAMTESTSSGRVTSAPDMSVTVTPVAMPPEAAEEPPEALVEAEDSPEAVAEDEPVAAPPAEQPTRARAATEVRARRARRGALTERGMVLLLGGGAAPG